MTTQVRRTVPELSTQRLRELSAKIKPVFLGSEINKDRLSAFLKVYSAENGLTVSQAIDLAMGIPDRQFYVKDVDPRLHFLNPRELANAASRKRSNIDLEPIALVSPLEQIERVRTFHRGFRSSAPSIVEVLAQMPKRIESQVAAFRTGAEAMVSDMEDDTYTCDTYFYGLLRRM